MPKASRAISASRRAGRLVPSISASSRSGSLPPTARRPVIRDPRVSRSVFFLTRSWCLPRSALNGILSIISMIPLVFNCPSMILYAQPDWKTLVYQIAFLVRGEVVCDGPGV